MAQPQSPTTPTDFDTFPSLLARSATAPTGFLPQRPDRSRLAPEDAFYAPSPPRCAVSPKRACDASEAVPALRSQPRKARPAASPCTPSPV